MAKTWSPFCEAHGRGLRRTYCVLGRAQRCQAGSWSGDRDTDGEVWTDTHWALLWPAGKVPGQVVGDACLTAGPLPLPRKHRSHECHNLGSSPECEKGLQFLKK